MATATRERMSATQATSFDSFSVANATKAESALDCGCKAYEDIFTYKRWQAQGFQVQKGQKAVHLPLIKSIEREDKETGEITHKRIHASSTVFCWHQVEPLNGETPAPVQRAPEPTLTNAPLALGPGPSQPPSKVDQLMTAWKEV